MQIMFVQFFSILPHIQNTYIKRCTHLLACNILPYNISSITQHEIVFYTQDKTVYTELLSNKTTDQLIAMVHVIFNYTFSHIAELKQNH